LIATVLLAFAAFNTGNNLIYLVLALMISIVVISIVSLILNTRGLSLDISLRGPVYAGQGADLEVSVSNSKRVLPSYSLRIHLPKGIEGRCTIAKVDPSSCASVECPVVLNKRGVYRWGDFTLESGFPFIFMTRAFRVRVEGAVVVYPGLVEVPDLNAYSGEGLASFTIRPGGGEELLSIREFRAGDDVRRVSWKATAKAQKLMVKELAEERPRSVNIILDDIAPFDGRAFERAVSYAASFAYKLLDEGYYVGLVTAAKRLPYGSGMEQLYKILDVLAVVRETESALTNFESDPSGTSVLVLKSAASPIKNIGADMVVYAS